MKSIITAMAILNTGEGKKLAYTYSKVDEKGMIIESNVKQSFVILDNDLLNLANTLEQKVSEHLTK